MTGRLDGDTAGRPIPGDAPAVPPSSRPVDLPGSGRLLAIDWGEKRIGLALSDPTQLLAHPLATLTRRAGRRFPMRSLRDHIEEHRPVGIVVGLPLEVDGSEGKAAAAAREMGEMVALVTGLPAFYADERMTTSRVKRTIAEMGGKTRGREQEVDQLAATVLLQGCLDRWRP